VDKNPATVLPCPLHYPEEFANCAHTFVATVRGRTEAAAGGARLTVNRACGIVPKGIPVIDCEQAHPIGDGVGRRDDWNSSPNNGLRLARWIGGDTALIKVMVPPLPS
jgi:hypothetical protein